MKNTDLTPRLLTTMLLCLGLLLSTASLHAQSGCDLYFPQAEGTTLLYQGTDKKDKPTGTYSYTILKKEGNTRTIEAMFADKKGEEQGRFTYDVVCEGSTIKIDMRSFIANMSAGLPDGFEVRGEVSYLELPGNLSVGQSLPDGQMSMEIYSDGNKFSEMDIAMTNRRVSRQESVTTPAGTFECWVLESDFESKTRIETPLGSGPAISFKGRSVDFLAVGVGLVRAESYNKNDKFMGATVLQEVK